MDILDTTLLTNSAMTALFLAMGYALIYTLKYFVNKRKEEDNMKKYGLQKEHEELLHNINKKIETLYEWHNVHDDNHVFKWYVPAELLQTVRTMSTELHILNKDILETIGEIKGGQTVLVEKLFDLINSQKLMTERLGDLIKKLYANSDF